MGTGIGNSITLGQFAQGLKDLSQGVESMKRHFFIGSGIKKYNRKLWFYVPTVFLSLLSVGCGQQSQPIEAAISKMGLTGQTGESATTALNISATTYVCVLGPYSRRVTAPSVLAKEVNDYLAKLEYLDDDGIWTFVYGTTGNWTVERISRRQLELIPLKTERGEKADAICGQAIALQLIKPAQGKVTFTVKEEK